jgi:hypothetical protein
MQLSPTASYVRLSASVPQQHARSCRPARALRSVCVARGLLRLLFSCGNALREVTGMVRLAQEFQGDQKNLAEVSAWSLARAQALSEQAALRAAWMRGQVGPHMSTAERLTLAEAVATQVRAQLNMILCSCSRALESVVPRETQRNAGIIPTVLDRLCFAVSHIVCDATRHALSQGLHIAAAQIAPRALICGSQPKS